MALALILSYFALYIVWRKKYSNWQTIEQKIKQTPVMRANHDWNRLLVIYFYLFFRKIHNNLKLKLENFAVKKIHLKLNYDLLSLINLLSKYRA